MIFLRLNIEDSKVLGRIPKTMLQQNFVVKINIAHRNGAIFNKNWLSCSDQTLQWNEVDLRVLMLKGHLIMLVNSKYSLYLNPSGVNCFSFSYEHRTGAVNSLTLRVANIDSVLRCFTRIRWCWHLMKMLCCFMAIKDFFNVLQTGLKNTVNQPRCVFIHFIEQ